MNLETRIIALENKVGCNDEPGPLIMIDVADCQKGSTDTGTARMAVIPGKIGGPCGFTLTRGETEDPADFLGRAELEHSNFYND